MKKDNKKRVVILGAGLSAMIFALQLNELDKEKTLDIVILERENKVGGLLNSHNYRDYWFDNGCYYFNSVNTFTHRYPELFTPVKSFKATVWTKIGLLDFPIKPKEILKKSSIRMRYQIAQDILLGNLYMLFKRPNNAKEWLKQRIGTTMLHYSGLDIYLEKLQTIKLDELSVSMCRSRLASLDKNIFTMIKHFLRTKHQSLAQTNFQQLLYVPGGVSKISNTIYKSCRDNGIKFELNTKIKSIQKEGDFYTMDTFSGSYEADKIVSTIPIPLLTDYVNMNTAQPMFLDYTKHFITDILVKKVNQKEDNFFIYSFINEHKWKRITGIKMPDDCYSLVVETNIKRDVPIDEKQLQKHIITSLIKDIKLFQDNDLCYISSHIVDYSYPIFSKRNEKFVEEISQRLSQEWDITLVGRQAEFKYYSAAKSFISAIEKATNFYQKL